MRGTKSDKIMPAACLGTRCLRKTPFIYPPDKVSQWLVESRLISTPTKPKSRFTHLNSGFGWPHALSCPPALIGTQIPHEILRGGVVSRKPDI